MTKEGTILDGKYEIWKEVGRGGMSIVYLARDNRLNKQWAVKEIKNDGSKSAQTLLKGLEREANILKNVDHAVLPRIVDIINQEGTIYVVMDFIEGETISDRLKKEGAQPQELVIEWGMQLASALDYLHNMNPPVIYRDMKPSNVMIKPEGGVKLIDFGTAKEYVIENNADTTALGTRGYAAPEQFGDAQGRGIYNTDARTDIYNLGATLYHIVTGMNPCEPPYEIKPIRTWNPNLSTGLEKIITKCTQADPNDRYQNCAELMYDLEHYTELDDSYRKKNKNKMAAFVATFVLAVVAGITSFVGYKGMKKIDLENYNSYIEVGYEYSIQGEYEKAAAEYKKAFDLDGSRSDAYIKYMNVYISAYGEETGDKDLDKENQEKINFCLNTVANRVEEGRDGVDKNDEVIFELACAYFNEVDNGYNIAAKYFGYISEDYKDYQKAEAYRQICSMLSEGISYEESEESEEFVNTLNVFYDKNIAPYDNEVETKYVNYNSLATICVANKRVPGVATFAEEKLNKAIEDFAGYTVTDTDKYDYEYEFYTKLSAIYGQLAMDEKDAEAKNQYYLEQIEQCENSVKKIQKDIDKGYVEDVLGQGGTENRSNVRYYNMMNTIASSYMAMYDNSGDDSYYQDAIETYQEMESVFGKDNDHYSKLVYGKHMGCMVEHYEEAEGEYDMSKWSKNAKEQMLALYEEAKDVPGIEDADGWIDSDDVEDLQTEDKVEPEDVQTQEGSSGASTETDEESE